MGAMSMTVVQAKPSSYLAACLLRSLYDGAVRLPQAAAQGKPPMCRVLKGHSHPLKVVFHLLLNTWQPQANMATPLKTYSSEGFYLRAKTMSSNLHGWSL